MHHACVVTAGVRVDSRSTLIYFDIATLQCVLKELNEIKIGVGAGSLPLAVCTARIDLRLHPCMHALLHEV